MDKERRKYLQEKSIAGLLTMEDMQEIVHELRAERVSAGYASRNAKKKKNQEKEGAREEMERDLFAGLHEDEPTSNGDGE